jgi:hypothetical protein
MANHVKYVADGTVLFNLDVRDSKGDQIVPTGVPVWTSSNTAVATVSATALGRDALVTLATPRIVGTTILKITFNALVNNVSRALIAYRTIEVVAPAVTPHENIVVVVDGGGEMNYPTVA